MKTYHKEKRIEYAVTEVIKDSMVLDKQVIGCLLESIFETINLSANQVYDE